MPGWYDTVARNAGHNVTTVNPDAFVEHLLPKVSCLKETAAKVVDKIKTENRYWYKGWWQMFNKVPKDYKSRPSVVYQKLSHISHAIRVAVAGCDKALASRQRAQHIVVPKQSANPMNYFLFNDFNSLDGLNPYWMDVAATGEFWNEATAVSVEWVRSQSGLGNTTSDYHIDRREDHRHNGNYIQRRPTENTGVRIYHRGPQIPHVVRNSVGYVRLRSYELLLSKCLPLEYAFGDQISFAVARVHHPLLLRNHVRFP